MTRFPWLEASLAALSAVVVVWLGSWGYASLERASVARDQLMRAAKVSRALADEAARGRASAAVTTLDEQAKAVVARAFVTEQGGVDEYGIARGSGLIAGGEGLSDAARQGLLNHAKSLVAATERAEQRKERLPWSRLQVTLEDGSRVFAVPYRVAVGRPAAGIAGCVIQPTPTTKGNAPWVWFAPLLAALCVVAVGRWRPASRLSALAAQGIAVGMVALSAPELGHTPLSSLGEASPHLFAHTAAPGNEALDSASSWLLGALLLLGAALGGGLKFFTSVVRALRGDAAPYAYVGPAVIATGVLIFVPFFIGVGLSFTSADGAFVGLDNYVEVIRSFADPNSATHFTRTFLHTVVWTVMNVTAHVTIGLGLALLLNRPNLRARKVYRLLLIIPWAVPNYITALTWKWMFNTQYGPVNVIMGGLGLEPVDWLGQSTLTNFTANLVTNIWLGFPFMMVISLGALQSIPAELYEAASIDGASPWQRFRHITLPLLKPALFPAIILGTIWTFNAFNVIYLVSGGGPDHQTEILITEAYYLFTVLRRTGLAAAYSVLIFLLLLVYTLVTNRLTSATEAVDR